MSSMTRPWHGPTPLVRLLLLALVVVCGAPAAARAQAGDAYFPDRFDWQTREPAQVGMDAARLQDAIRFSIENENPDSKDLAVSLQVSFGREPFGDLVGPTRERGAMNGLVIRSGYVVAEWGDTRRVDMTFSVTKTFLSTVVGLAWQKGLIRDVHDPARDYFPPPDLFASEHNAKVTWDHLLRMASEWEGTLWGKPHWADRPVGENPQDWPNQALSEPGTRYKYSDVRANLLALGALHVWRRPLPQVLREEIMEPIGASSTWRWHGYDNSWIEIDGQRVQSVSGGGHWGGGMFINAWDLARFGYLFLRNGRWNDRQLVSEEWIGMARTPGVSDTYGYMNWYLNPDRRALPAVPATAVTFRGAGANIVYIDWENDLVVVVRWIGGGGALNEFLGKVVGAIEAAAPTAP